MCVCVCVRVCVFVCRWVLNCSGEYHTCSGEYLFTVWYICTPVACDSRYTLSTVRKVTPRAVTVLSRGISIVIIILKAFSPFRKIFLLYNFIIYVYRRISLKFIEMVPFIRNDCTVTSCTHVWLL